MTGITGWTRAAGVALVALTAASTACGASSTGAPVAGCVDDGDCEGSACVTTPAGRECAPACAAGCPGGWACRAGLGLCMPVFERLCRPCIDDEDCGPAADGVPTSCLDAPEGVGRFCATPCGDRQPCPEGYECTPTLTDGGDTVGQCTPAAGVRACSPEAIAARAETVCFSANDLGTCEGARACTATGLSQCDAPAPAAERCNAIDDDCDGVTDEGLTRACAVVNDFGRCVDKETCVQGDWICGAPTPAAEVCDGVDNDCSGATDEGFPDLDGDARADCVDDDDDGDGVDDPDDNCPRTYNPDQRDVCAGVPAAAHLSFHALVTPPGATAPAGAVMVRAAAGEVGVVGAPTAAGGSHDVRFGFYQTLPP